MATPTKLYLNLDNSVIDVKTGKLLPAFQAIVLSIFSQLSNAILGLPPTPGGVVITGPGGAPSVSTTLPAVDGSALLNLNASQLLLGTVPQGRKWTEATTTAVGVQNNLGFSSADVFRCNNASSLTIDGLIAGVAGQRLVIRSVGAGVVILADEAAGSSAANRILTGLSGNVTVRSATLDYDGADVRWKVRSYEPAEIQVAALPVAPPIGAQFDVSNSSVVIWGAPVVGGGGNRVRVRWNGANYTVMGI